MFEQTGIGPLEGIRSSHRITTPPWVRAVPAPRQPAKPFSVRLSRYELLTPADLAALPAPSWMIENILPKNSLAVLYGEPGSGKTFVALSIALSIAAGHNWCGIRTEKG